MRSSDAHGATHGATQAAAHPVSLAHSQSEAAERAHPSHKGEGRRHVRVGPRDAEDDVSQTRSPTVQSHCVDARADVQVQGAERGGEEESFDVDLVLSRHGDDVTLAVIRCMHACCLLSCQASWVSVDLVVPCV